MVVLGLRFCARALSSCGKWGPFFIMVRGPLTIAASLVAEHRLQTRRLSSCGSRAQLLRGMCDLPRPGLEPVSPALAGRFSTTAPPGKPWFSAFSTKPLCVSKSNFVSRWNCTEICELFFISVGSRTCAGCVKWIIFYSIIYGDITEERAVVDKEAPKQFKGRILHWFPRTWWCTPVDIFSTYICCLWSLIRVKSW